MSIISRRTYRRLLFLLFASHISLLFLGSIAAYRTYGVSCIAADHYIANAYDGPWVRSRVHLVIAFDESASPTVAAPMWVFRFRNSRDGGESRRIYVTFFGNRTFTYKAGVLDPLPILGSLP